MTKVSPLTVIGLKEMQAKLEELAVAPQRRAARRALTHAANVLRDAARQNAPVRFGILKKSIKSRTSVVYGVPTASVYIEKGKHRVSTKAIKRQRRDKSGRFTSASSGSRTITVSPRSTAHLVEFGTKPHSYRKRAGLHPGAKARPFMRPAMDTKGPLAVRTFETVLNVEIEKEAAKLAAKKAVRR